MPEALAGAVDLRAALAVERIDDDLFRANFVQVEEYPLYGGQVAAQALAAAGATVPGGRQPHSLHGYFLRPGEADRPTMLRVERDRDGRSFSARRVIAVQQGEVIFNLAASFHDAAPEPVQQWIEAPAAAPPEELVELDMHRYPAVEVRAERQPPGRLQLPHRFWARVRHPLPADPLAHACALTYVSDLSTGLRKVLPDIAPAASLDHALWIHRVPRADDWLLVELTGLAVAGRRGHYSGSIFTPDGRLAASLAQEMLIRR